MAPETTAAEVVQRAGVLLRDRLQSAESVPDADERQRLVDEAIMNCLATLAKTGIWGEANQLLSSQLWNIAGDLLETGWLQARARHKPRGYAGDHELLRRIAEREICMHPLGRCLDQYFQSQAAPQAVRNRIALAAGWIVDAVNRNSAPVFRVASVGSGPALDVAIACLRLHPEHRSQLRVTLLDLDGEALDQATQRLSTHLDASQMTIVQSNIFRLAERPSLAESLQGCNLILCTGLFDYLPHPAAVAILGEFWKRLAPGGAAYVFNFAPDNPTRAYMEWLGNWYLLYRQKEEMAALAAAAGIAREHYRLGAEPLGIDVYLALSKPKV
ncbi:MAG: class I SAM-dependent methyltransferase [Planctomycetales bacterium]|nr:class I SAM-dependent methyltransferase [Planctomycetales bacterium]